MTSVLELLFPFANRAGHVTGASANGLVTLPQVLDAVTIIDPAAPVQFPAVAVVPENPERSEQTTADP